jgi:HEAT repeat protein
LITGRDVNTPVQLEGPTHLFVMYRIFERKVDKVRQFTPDCPVDAGGLTFHWLTDVKPAESVALLESLISQTERSPGGVISTIALHRDAAADTALDRLLATSQPENIRRSATQVLGSTRGKAGYDRLMKLLRDDPSDRVRESAVHALTQSKETGAMQAVVRAASEDKSPQVRSQALMFLAQRATRQISESAIRDAIEKDADTSVKERAVSALSQIPRGEGVPMLIEVARNNRNAAIRKRAMQELGRSRDPRAVKFFEDVLSR